MFKESSCIDGKPRYLEVKSEWSRINLLVDANTATIAEIAVACGISDKKQIKTTELGINYRERAFGGLNSRDCHVRTDERLRAVLSGIEFSTMSGYTSTEVHAWVTVHTNAFVPPISSVRIKVAYMMRVPHGPLMSWTHKLPKATVSEVLDLVAADMSTKLRQRVLPRSIKLFYKRLENGVLMPVGESWIQPDRLVKNYQTETIGGKPVVRLICTWSGFDFSFYNNRILTSKVNASAQAQSNEDSEPAAKRRKLQ